jgi:predicted nucleic-acid-binding Zn-ribbon protein
MPDCTACEQHFHRSHLRDGACASCRADFESFPSGAWLRPKGPCDKCGHDEIIRSQQLRHADRYGAPFGAFGSLTPLFVALSRRVLSYLDTLTGTPPPGLLEAYVCRSCGYTELYARNPSGIPITQGWGTEAMLKEAPPDNGPYR